MIISVNWLKKFTDITMPIDQLATLIGARLVEIEEVIDLGAKYKGVVVARVMSCEDIEGSDHLHRCMVDDAGVTAGIERDENGYVQVVCGAPNVREGMLVAWLPPRATVPQTHGTAEPFVLDARKLRGVMSNGMLASARELDLFDEHDGILEVDSTAKPGDAFADAYELNDYLLDIENKSLTHRPDCFGIVGFAREVAAIQGTAFTTPDWMGNVAPDFGSATGGAPAPHVTIENTDLSARYQAVVLSNADSTATSSLLVQTYLARVGVRPINAVVDVTNYLMMLTGQPLHAFDYDKVLAIGGANISVRGGRQGETLKLLDGRTISLSPEDIVIVSGDTPIALAGAMGGADTEIDATTKNIIIESATFNLFNLRATQMRHGIFSEAITRVTKGQPAALTAPVLADAVRLMGEWTGAKQISEVADCYPHPTQQPVIKVTVEYINSVLGSTITAKHIVTLLTNAEFTVNQTGRTLNITAPYWRSDIHIPEDSIEEVGRLYGFDTIVPQLPGRDFTAVRPTEFDHLKSKIRSIMARGGANEVLTYSFVHGDLLTKAGQKPADSYRLTNSISPDLQYYRQTLTPSLLNLVHANIKAGYDDFALFELNKTHNKVHGLDAENLPGELNMLAAVIAHKKPETGAAFYEAKRLLDYIAVSLGLSFVYAPMTEDPGYPVTAPFEYRRSALVTDQKSGEFIGIVGEYKKTVARSFKLPEAAAGFEIGSEALLAAAQAKSSSYRAPSRYPGTDRDVCFTVSAAITYDSIVAAVTDVVKQSAITASVSPVDIYQSRDADTKNITLRIHFVAYDRTLAGDEVAQVMTDVHRYVSEKTGAIVV